MYYFHMPLRKQYPYLCQRFYTSQILQHPHLVHHKILRHNSGMYSFRRLQIFQLRMLCLWVLKMSCTLHYPLIELYSKLFHPKRFVNLNWSHDHLLLNTQFRSYLGQTQLPLQPLRGTMCRFLKTREFHLMNMRSGPGQQLQICLRSR